ncbi:MAG: esterase [Pseudomonadota bacterium]
MRQTNFALALLAAAALTACGGSDSNGTSTAAKPVFTAQVSFGDSLSDVGTYKVGGVAFIGGGKYTINGDNTGLNPALHGKNWTELMAAQLHLPAPCPAVTGLTGDAAHGFSVPIVDHPTCFGYGQGGARVINPIGSAHNTILGPMTDPVVTQVALHLTRATTFKAGDIIYVWAGGNDLLVNLDNLTAAATAAGNAAGAAAGATAGAQAFVVSLSTRLTVNATDPAAAKAAVMSAMAAEAARPGSTSATLVGVAVMTAATQPGNAAVGSPAVYGPMIPLAQADATAAGTAAGQAAGAAAGAAYATANGPALVPLMAQAGTDLALLIKNQMIAKGATHIVVNSLPDVATSTPNGRAQSASAKQLIGGMVSAFNIALRVGIDGLEDKVLWVDLFAASQDQVLNPGKYGISNADIPACGANPLGTTSLGCNASNTLPGVDVSHYLFADNVHPAPYGQTLIAKAVADAMIAKGWL